MVAWASPMMAKSWKSSWAWAMNAWRSSPATGGQRAALDGGGAVAEAGQHLVDVEGGPWRREYSPGCLRTDRARRRCRPSAPDRWRHRAAPREGRGPAVGVASGEPAVAHHLQRTQRPVSVRVARTSHTAAAIMAMPSTTSSRRARASSSRSSRHRRDHARPCRCASSRPGDRAVARHGCHIAPSCRAGCGPSEPSPVRRPALRGLHASSRTGWPRTAAASSPRRCRRRTGRVVGRRARCAARSWATARCMLGKRTMFKTRTTVHRARRQVAGDLPGPPAVRPRPDAGRPDGRPVDAAHPDEQPARSDVRRAGPPLRPRNRRSASASWSRLIRKASWPCGESTST